MQAIRPHDSLFKFVFGEPEQMADLLRACLPEEVAAAIDWSTLERVSGSFVDRALRGRETDLLFSARMGDTTVLLYLLPEHKSANHRLAAWQLACYVVRILEQWLREHPGATELPPVLPIVVYHGDTPWQSPRTPRDLVDWRRCAPAVAAFLRPLQLDLPYLLLDLSQVDEARIDALRLSAVSSLTLRFLQFLRRSSPSQVAASLRRWSHLLGVLATHPRGRDVLYALMTWYIASSKADLETARSAMNEIREENEPMQNVFDLWFEETLQERLEKAVQERMAHELPLREQQLMQQVMQRGMQQGMLHGLRTMLAGQLRARFGELPAHVAARLDDADAATLQTWGARLLRAEHIDDVVAAG